MNLFKRVTHTVISKVETMVSQVENHDAIVEAALNDTRAASARAKIRLTRVHKDGEEMRRREEALRQDEAMWEKRAISTAAQDETKALECINRRNVCRKQREQLSQVLVRHDEVERDIAGSVKHIEQRLTELTQQRNLMRSRHSAADALRVIQHMEGQATGGIDDVFERWDMSITESEYASGKTASADRFEASFTEQEHEALLKADLQALLNETTHAVQE